VPTTDQLASEQAPPKVALRRGFLSWETIEGARGVNCAHMKGRYLVQLDYHIAEAMKRIALQRGRIARLQAARQPIITAQSALDVLEASLLALQRHRELILELSAKMRSAKGPQPAMYQ
jgi:hypothetical protein